MARCRLRRLAAFDGRGAIVPRGVATPRRPRWRRCPCGSSSPLREVATRCLPASRAGSPHRPSEVSNRPAFTWAWAVGVLIALRRVTTGWCGCACRSGSPEFCPHRTRRGATTRDTGIAVSQVRPRHPFKGLKPGGGGWRSRVLIVPCECYGAAGRVAGWTESLCAQDHMPRPRLNHASRECRPIPVCYGWRPAVVAGLGDKSVTNDLEASGHLS